MCSTVRVRFLLDPPSSVGDDLVKVVHCTPDHGSCPTICFSVLGNATPTHMRTYFTKQKDKLREFHETIEMLDVSDGQLGF